MQWCLTVLRTNLRKSFNAVYDVMKYSMVSKKSHFRANGMISFLSLFSFATVN